MLRPPRCTCSAAWCAADRGPTKPIGCAHAVEQFFELGLDRRVNIFRSSARHRFRTDDPRVPCDSIAIFDGACSCVNGIAGRVQPAQPVELRSVRHRY